LAGELIDQAEYDRLVTLPKIYRLRQSDGTSTAAIVDGLLERSIQRKRIAECRDRPPSILDVEKEDPRHRNRRLFWKSRG
jgi:hypothetical protein